MTLRLVGLIVAVLAAGWLLTLPAPDPAPVAAGTADAGVQEVWPKATVVRTPGRLSDGRAYTPWYHRDASTSVGTALTNDGMFLRLLVRTPSAERELLRLPAGDNPQFNGFAGAGDDLVFMVSAGSMSASTLYGATWSDGVARLLTEDTGAVVFFNSQHDVVIADGAAHWAAAGANGQFTQVRSVPLAGGAVAVRRVDGSYALSAWPWLTSAGTDAVRLYNPQTGATQPVAAAPDEMVTCGPVWCRVLVIGPGGQPARTDVMRPSGADRRRLAAGNTTSAVLDVALLDRFEVLTQTAPADGPVSLTLVLYDLANDRAVPLARGVATVQARGPVVWWSTGSEEAGEWFALDLRTLT